MIYAECFAFSLQHFVGLSHPCCIILKLPNQVVILMNMFALILLVHIVFVDILAFLWHPLSAAALYGKSIELTEQP